MNDSGVWGHPGFPGGSVVKNPPANAGDAILIPESGKSPGGGNGNQLQQSCLENPMDKGAPWAAVKSVVKSQTHLSDCMDQEYCLCFHLPIERFHCAAPEAGPRFFF